MTQIQLRRDTAANFASKNPVLGIGEPAYETDTKKLKIGDGTTVYNSLDYFASGGKFTVVQPLKLVDGTLTLQIDEQTIQVVDGKLHANLDELGNEVNSLSGRVTAAEADILKKQNKLVQGDNITLTDNEDGTTTVAAVAADLPIASSAVLGGIKVGDNLVIANDGTLSAVSDTPTIDLIDGGNALGVVARAQEAQVTSPLDNGAMPSTTVTVEDVE